MSTKTVDICEAQAHLSELLESAIKGDNILIASEDKTLVRLVAVATSKTDRVAGLHRGKVWISDDFDDPLPDSLWEGEE